MRCAAVLLFLIMTLTSLYLPVNRGSQALKKPSNWKNDRSRVRRYQQPFDLVRKAAQEAIQNADFKIIDEGPTFVLAERCCFNQWEWNAVAGVYLRPVEDGTEVVLQTKFAPDAFAVLSLGTSVIAQADAAKQYRLQIFGAIENQIGLLRQR
jgi:hypothetical protein